MNGRDSSAIGVGQVVSMTLPWLGIQSRDQLVAALHRADRRLGVGVGREGDRLRLLLLTEKAGDEAAGRKASALLAEALQCVGLAPEIANRVLIERIADRTLSPGRARPTGASAQLEYRAVALPDGRMMHVAHERPLGNWTAYRDGADELAWTGRNLLSVLSELLALPHGKKDGWVGDAIRELTGRETPRGTRYPCACCDCFTLEEPPSGTFAICPVCGWEDDNVQYADPDYQGGANTSSLRQARDSFQRAGVSEARRSKRVRPPLDDERP